MTEEQSGATQKVVDDTPGVTSTSTDSQVLLEETSDEEQTPAGMRQQDPLPDYEDLYVRAVADLENFRKQSLRRQSEAVEYASKELAKNLLPVLDHFRLAIEHGEASDGVQIAFKELIEVLTQAGLQEIEVHEGSPFDPNLHHALTTVPDGSVDFETVKLVHRPGYRFKEHVVRAPEVVVAQPTSNDGD